MGVLGCFLRSGRKGSRALELGRAEVLGVMHVVGEGEGVRGGGWVLKSGAAVLRLLWVA